MKNLRKILLLAFIFVFLVFSLVACSSSSTSDSIFYKGSYSDGSYVTILKDESGNDERNVYQVIVQVSNEGSSYSVNAIDFTIKVLNETYICEFFILSSKLSSTTVNEITKKITLVTSKAETYNIASKEDSIQMIYCAFLVNPTENFNIYYKETLLGSLT